MNGTRAIAVQPDGTTQDITTAVQALYDLVINSLDWGSGFLSVEDAEPVAEMAVLFDFEQREEVQRYVASMRHAVEAQAWIHDHPEAQEAFSQREQMRRLISGVGVTGLLGYGADVLPHDHVYSEAMGKCMWPRCSQTRPT